MSSALRGKTIAVLDLGYDSYPYEKNLLKKNGYDLKLFTGNSNDLAVKK